MRELLVKKVVTLKDLWITFDMDHCQKELRFLCEPSIVDGTGRMLTDAQLSGIAQVLFGNSRMFSNISQTSANNLLPYYIRCCMVFSDNTLVAISNKEEHLYCYLETGEVVDEETLFKICKQKKLENTLSQIKFLLGRIASLASEYEELEKMTF